MFIKTGHLHLTYFFLIIIVVRVLDSQSRSPSFKTTGWLQGQLNLSFSQGWELSGTLSPRSGSVALRQLNPIHIKVP